MTQHTLVHELLRILVSRTVVSAGQAADIERAFRASSIEYIEEYLLTQGLVSKKNILEALSVYYKVPSFEVSGVFFDEFLLQNFPKDFLLREGIIPYEQDGELLVVIAAEPTNPDLASKINAYTDDEITFFVGLRVDIQDAVKEFYDKSLTEVSDDDAS